MNFKMAENIKDKERNIFDKIHNLRIARNIQNVTKDYENTLAMLNEGKGNIILGVNKDVVLVLGNSGSGKSTLTQYVAGDNSQMRSIEVEENTGEYIITDDNSRISNSSITSKTIYPELVVDPETNVAYYDCPGFSDTRSTAIDITSTYFVKTVIDYVDRVKIVLTVGYPSVRRGVDRFDFMKLLEHVTELVKDIDKFKDCFVLVVTKVDNEYVKKGERFTLVSDDKVMGLIGSFLTEVKKSLHEKQSVDGNLQQKNFYTKAVKLIDVLLSKKNGSFTRLGIFRRPDVSGIISEIPTMQKGKRTIKHMINGISFVKKTKYDFGYTISERSKNGISHLVEKINGVITYHMTDISEEIKEHFCNKAMQIKDLYELRNDLKKEYDDIANLTGDLRKLTKPRQFFKKMFTSVGYSHYGVLDNNLIAIRNQINYLEFLEEIGHSELHLRLSSDWERPLSKISIYCNNFLIDLYEKLSEYNIQQSIVKYNVADINNWGQLVADQGIHINQFNWKLFLNKIKDLNVNAFEVVKDMAIDEINFELLNQLLDATLKHKTSFECSDSNKLTVIGEYVKFTEIIEKWHICNVTITFLEIFALHSVFIDEDLVMTGDKVRVVIIAPTWEVLGKRLINIDGLPALQHKDPKANNGRWHGQNGAHGKPGLPGGSAGTFLGIGLKFKNGQGLTISANGGAGGDGQSGGNGTVGQRGESPQKPSISKSDSDDIWKDNFATIQLNKARGISSFVNTGKTSDKDKPVGNSRGHSFIMLAVVVRPQVFFQWETFTIFGKDGGKGGNGGNGGRGGPGGYGGRINIVEIDRVSEISTVNNNGTYGLPGTGGDAEIGGQNGDTVEAEMETHTGLNFYTSWPSWKRWDASSNFKRGPPGVRGLDGTNNYGFKEPDLTAILNSSRIVNKYKLDLMERCNSIVKSKVQTNFHNELLTNHKINELYDLLGMVNELESVEKVFYKLKDRINFPSYYRHFLSRIEYKAQNQENNEMLLENRKVLNYLYTATLSKICSLEDGSKSNLIIDINGYLDLTENNIRKYEKGEQFNAINAYKQMFAKDLNKQIDEAVDFVNVITTELDSYNRQIESNIDLLIRETENLRKNVEIDNVLLIEQESKLKNALMYKYIFNSISAVGQVIKLLGPWGALAGNIIGVTSSIAEGLVLDETSTQKNVKAIPEGISALLNHSVDIINVVKAKKMKVLEKQLVILEQETQRNPNILNDTLTAFKDIHKRIETKFTDKINSAEINILENELKQILEKKKQEFKSSKDLNSRTALRVIHRLNDVAKIGVDLYVKYKQNESQMNEISIAIERSREQISELKQFEERIYISVYPMLERMRENMDQVQGDLKRKSKISLTVIKWQVQNSLKDMKSQMQQITTGFQVQGNLARSIEKVDEAMTTLINVYDQVQNYQEQKKLTDYIAEIASAGSRIIHITDQELNEAVSNLEVVIQSNIILGQYERAVNGFKQYVFPFADFYLKEFSLPADMQVANNVDSLVASAIRGLRILKSKLTESNVSVNKKYDRYIHTGDFQSRHKSTKPFYVWTNEDYRNLISKLLAGEEVLVKADAVASIENSVKFNLIGIYFKSSNQTMQNELDDKLRSFGVTMTHMGNSYYRCDDDIYVISSKSQTLSHSFEMNKDTPVTKNRVYEKILNGDVMLSPYAMWKIKLTNLSNTRFGELGIYKDEVDLELVGKGQYLSSDAEVCNSNLKSYYRLDETLSNISKLNVGFAKDSLVSQPSETIIQLDRQSRDVTGYEDLERVASSSTSTLSSPINVVFIWLTTNLPVHAWNPMKRLASWFLGNNKYQTLRYHQQDYHHAKSFGESLVEPIAFYEHVDSGLALAPVLLHLWNKFFNRTSTKSQVEETSSLELSVDRVKLWDCFLGDARELMTYLERVLGSRQAAVMWYVDALDAREKEVRDLTRKAMVNPEEVKNLDENLMAFQRDINEDVMYSRYFSNMINDKKCIAKLRKLNQTTQQMSRYQKVINTVQRSDTVNYRENIENKLLIPYSLQATERCSVLHSYNHELTGQPIKYLNYEI